MSGRLSSSIRGALSCMGAGERSTLSRLLLLSWVSPCVAASPHTDALSRLLAAAIAMSEGTIVSDSSHQRRPLPTLVRSTPSCPPQTVTSSYTPTPTSPNTTEPNHSFTHQLLRRLSSSNPMQLRRSVFSGMVSAQSTVTVVKATLSYQSKSYNTNNVVSHHSSQTAMVVPRVRNEAQWFDSQLRQVLKAVDVEVITALFGMSVCHLLEISSITSHIDILLRPSDISLPQGRELVMRLGRSAPIDEAIVLLFALCASSSKVSEGAAFRMAEVLLASGVVFRKETTKYLCACLQSAGKGSTALLFAQWSHAELGLRGLMKEIRRSQQRQYCNSRPKLKSRPSSWQEALAQVGNLTPDKSGRPWSTQVERALVGQFCDALEFALEARAVLAVDTLISRFVPAGISPSRKVVLRVLLNTTAGKQYESIRARALRALWSRASYDERIRMEETVLTLSGAPIHLLIHIGENPFQPHLPSRPQRQRLTR